MSENEAKIGALVTGYFVTIDRIDARRGELKQLGKDMQKIATVLIDNPDNLDVGGNGGGLRIRDGGPWMLAQFQTGGMERLQDLVRCLSMLRAEERKQIADLEELGLKRVIQAREHVGR